MPAHYIITSSEFVSDARDTDKNDKKLPEEVKHTYPLGESLPVF